MSELIRDIECYVQENRDALVRDIADLVAVNSVRGEALPGAPFGAGPAEALRLALQKSAAMGFDTADCDGRMGWAQLGDCPADSGNYLATITHLDIVPAPGWDADPFTLREIDGYLLGRGVMDDKGPSVLCLYAAKYFKDRGISLRYPIRVLLGVDEETGMGDLDYYLEHYPAPLFCFSPDADFPMCNGEKGLFFGNIISACTLENILDIRGGTVHNAVPESAEAVVKASALLPAERISVEDLGNGTWRVRASGICGHASMPQGTVNALRVLVDYLLDNGIPSEAERAFLEADSLLLRDWTGKLLGVDAVDDVFDPLTIVGGVMSVENGHIVQSVDCRYPTSTTGEKLSASIRAKLEGLASFEVLGDSVPFYMPADKPEVQALLDAYTEVTGEPAVPFTIGGGTYARHFPNAVSFGPEHQDRPRPAFVGAIHGVNEGAHLGEMLEALKVYILALAKLEGLEL